MSGLHLPDDEREDRDKRAALKSIHAAMRYLAVYVHEVEISEIVSDLSKSETSLRNHLVTHGSK